MGRGVLHHRDRHALHTYPEMASRHNTLLSLTTICFSSSSVLHDLYLFMARACSRPMRDKGGYSRRMNTSNRTDLPLSVCAGRMLPEYRGTQGPFDHDPLDGLIPCPLPQGLAVIHLISEMLKHGGLFLHRRRFFPLGEHRVKVDHCPAGCAASCCPLPARTFSLPRP